MIRYYYNLVNDNNIKSIDKKIGIATAILNTARRSFGWFTNYLNNSIESIEKKEEISARWKKVNTENLAHLKLIGNLFEIPKITLIKVDKNQIENIKVNDQIMGSVCPHFVISSSTEGLVLNPIPETEELLFYNKKPLTYSIVPPAVPDGRILIESDTQYIVYTREKSVVNGNKLPENKIIPFIDFDNIILNDKNEKLKFVREEGLTIKIENVEYYNKKVSSNNIEFLIEKPMKYDKHNYWIQLIEDEDNEKDDIPGFSPLKYFFDDDITVEDDKKNRYKMVDGIESEYKIVLKKYENNEFCFPPEGSILKIKVNTYNLRMQLDAIHTLLFMPLSYHKKIIELFEKKEKVHWETPSIQDINEWYLLKDDKRSGVNEQRDFVKKAVATPDFAILEGPPGSGKTTVILELICQIIKKGKRILLCGSTHVAIDNVLERLKEKREDGKSLIDKLGILPVRIGDEKRISEDIKEFQIDNLIEDNDIDGDFLLDISNLVCGTTIGILQNPKFKKRDKKVEPIYPEFDYLIIDEASKTKFQEFLVPALYAKKWILVGDIKQLSPFTEPDEIISNLENIGLDNEYQMTLFMLNKIEKALNYRNKFALPVSSNIINYTIKEIKAGRLKDKIISIIFSDSRFLKNNENNIFFHTKDNIKFLELVASDLIIFDESLFSEIVNKIPESFAILRNEKWKETEQAFIHNIYQKKYKFFYREKNQELDNSFEIVDFFNNFFKEKSWAGEIAWRLNREHEMRMIEGDKTNFKEKYRKAIEELLPVDIKSREEINDKIDIISSISFPSIIESLISGIPVIKNKRKIENKTIFEQTTISSGFDEEDLEPRRTILKYQHRMHPDISQFSRENFYNENALKDSSNPSIKGLRNWEYNKYPYRSVWINVKGNTIKNYNLDEVKTLIKELKDFIEYAKYNRQPENKDWSVACLTFYKGQERHIREELQKLTKNPNSYSNFYILDGKYKINIKLHTVDKFQGQEADIVFLSMVQTKKDGFLDNPNRLNVSITRAKFQLVIIGDHQYFAEKSNSEDLRKLAIFHKERLINES